MTSGPNGRYPVIDDSDELVYDVLLLPVIHWRDRTGFQETKEFPIEMGTVVAQRYRIEEYVGSWAFSRAVSATDLIEGRKVCLKIIKNDKDFVDQSLDEIKLLKFLEWNASNGNTVNGLEDLHILKLYDYFYFREHLILVTELLQDNLYEYSRYLRETQSYSWGDVDIS